jgi:hypothetical protein
MNISYAVELGELRRLYEARNISRIVLARPFAYAYPEWQKTAEDLKLASRSFAVIRPKRIRKAKILRMPLIERGEPAEAGELAPVVSLVDWKEKMAKGKKGKGNGGKKIEEMTEREVMFEIIRLSSNDTTTEHQRSQILAAIQKILSKPGTPEPDDDPEGV